MKGGKSGSHLYVRERGQLNLVTIQADLSDHWVLQKLRSAGQGKDRAKESA